MLSMKRSTPGSGSMPPGSWFRWGSLGWKGSMTGTDEIVIYAMLMDTSTLRSAAELHSQRGCPWGAQAQVA